MSGLLAISLCLAMVSPEDGTPDLLIVIGAAGTPEYGEMFDQWADQWQTAAKAGLVSSHYIGPKNDAEKPDRDRFKEYLSQDTHQSASEPLWIVLIGHGTFDGKSARFNLRGPDVTAAELAEWLAPINRPLAIINCTSSSGPFLNRLSAPGRVVVTATRSGHESNFARFGKYMAEAIADPRADLDQDNQVSLLEAFLTASSRVAEFYRSESRLATEHALIDDNGDQLGTPPDWFRGVRAIRKPKDDAQVDGTRAHQLHLIPSKREQAIPADVRRRRDELELKIAELRNQKSELGEEEYYQRLEKVMVELAQLYAKVPPIKRSSGK